jgi:DnaJ-class molecular chaperone
MDSYKSEVCGLCNGKGRSPDSPCPACNGQGTVLVHQPALACPRCGGKGRARSESPSFYFTPLCVDCGGTGWTMTRRVKQELPPE